MSRADHIPVSDAGDQPAGDAIRMTGVRKTFGRKVAVEGLDLSIPQGSLMGFIGPNGAGKTTSIRMIMAILFPDDGSLTVLGRRSALESKDRIGYLPEERGVYRKMKVLPFVRYIAKLKGLDGAGLDRNIHGWLERLQLPGVANKKCEELSKGMQQKVQYIASVIHEPDLLILDEPFSGLDPVNMRLLRDEIRRQHAEGRTVIFSTHVMSQAEQVCERIAMMHQGRKVLDGTIAEIKAEAQTRSVVFEPLEPGDTATVESVRGWDGISNVAQTERGFEAELDKTVEPLDIMRRIAAKLPVSRVELKRPTLEDIFIDIVAGSGDGEEEARLRAQLREGTAQDEDSAGEDAA
ncbi:MAG: ATP-binding cassette domain-containing protein [Planctomycetota bacterium]